MNRHALDAALGRMRTSYTLWSLFRNCRKAAYWRYIRGLLPLERDQVLAFGSLVHECLEIWHGRRDLAVVLDHIDRALPARTQDPEQRRAWHLATAMMRGYAARYPTEEFEVVALEKEFEGEITNPETGAASRSFTLFGKVDGIIRIDAEHFLLENKSATSVDGSYLERLWTDFQIVLYAYYVERALGIRIDGILHNILVKAKLQQSAGETEAEFEARRAELIAKSKTGKSSAKRRLPESDEEFQARLAEKYAEPGMFHREMLYVSRDQFDTLRAELWELGKALLDARRRDVFYQNTSYCFQYGKPCPYFPLCRSGGNLIAVENLYRRAGEDEPRADAPATETPAF